MKVREIMATIGLDFDDSGFKKADKQLKTLMGTFAAVAGVLSAAKAALEGLTFEVAKHGEHLGAMASKLGLTTDQLQDLANAGKIAGVDLEQMGGALEGIQEKLIAASRVDKEAMLAFMRAGVATHDAAGKMKPATEILKDLADQVAKQPNAARKMFVAQQLVGKGSDEMMRLLGKGRKGIQEYADEARGAGAVLSREFVEQATRFNLEIRKGLVNLDGFKNTIAVKVLPYMNKAIEAFNAWYKINGANVRSIASYASQAVMNGFTSIIDLVMLVVNNVRKLYEWLEKIYPGFGKFAAGIAIAAAAFKIFNLVMSANPIVKTISIVLALAAAFALVADDIKVFMHGGNSLFGRMVEWIGKFLGIEDAAGKVRKAFQDLWSGKLLEDALNWLTSIENAVEAWAGKVWETIKSPFKKLGDFLGFGGESASPTAIGQTKEMVAPSAKVLAGSVAGGGAASPAAAAQIAGPPAGSVDASRSSSMSDSRSYKQTNNVTINVQGGNAEDVTRAIEDYFGDEKQAAWAANTPGVPLPAGSQ